MMLKEVFEFEVLDPAKVVTVLSTHLPSLKKKKKKSSTDDDDDLKLQTTVLYASLLKRLKLLTSGYSDAFTATQAELKLCEIFTAKVLCSTGTFKDKTSDRQLDFYAPVLDIFTRAQVTCDLAYYFRLVHDMKWELFAAYLITEKAATATDHFFDVALDQLGEDADLSVFMTLTQIKVFRSLLISSKSSEEEEEEEEEKHNPLRFFSLASILVKQAAPDFAPQTERLLTYALSVLAHRHLATSSETIERLFRQRVALFGLEAIPFNSSTEDLLKSSLITEVAFTRVKINLQEPKLQRLSLRIIVCAFIAPLATYDNLLNSLLIFSPLHYNRFILHLFTHHLRPLSQVRSSVADVLNGGETQKGGKKQLSLLTALTILKFHANFDLLSGKSFTDFVQALTSGKVASSEEGGCGLPFEAMLANLLAYSNVQQSKEANSLSLQWLDMLYDLVNSCGQSSPSSSFSSSPPQKQHSFTVVAAFLLKLLSVVWYDPTKKELVGSIIRVYVQQKRTASGRTTTKIKPGALRRIQALLRRSPSVDNIPDLLHHLQENFSISVG